MALFHPFRRAGRGDGDLALRHLRSRLLVAAIVGALGLFAGGVQALEWGAVKLGRPDSAQSVAHLERAAALGFEAVWIPCRALGDEGDCPFPSRPSPRASRLFERLEQLELRPIVVLESRDLAGKRPKRRALKRWARDYGIENWVVRDAPGGDRESLAGWLRAIERVGRAWYAPDVMLGRGVDESRIELPGTTGIVVRGLDDREARAWVAIARERYGERPLLYDEGFPEIGEGQSDALALNLGPVRRGPGLAGEIEGYLVSPMYRYLAASRLSVETAAAYVADPESYDPKGAWERAIDRIAGDDAGARRALHTQATEWGGFIGERNYRPYLRNSPESVQADLRDPAASDAYRWVTRRYAERMHAMRGLDDGAFASEVALVMRRRLAIARAIPVVRQLQLGQGKRGDLSGVQLLDELVRQRRDLERTPDARAAFDRFTELCGLAGAIERQAIASEEPAR